jgi:hypothetical protein
LVKIHFEEMYMKKLIAVLLATAYLVGFSAFAADEHKCKAGEKWDDKAAKCVKDDTKK